MIAGKERLLDPPPSVGIPKHRHHVSEVVGRHVDAPAFPIQQPGIIASIRPRQKKIPWMGIAMDNGQVASQMVAREQIWRTIQQPCVKTLPVGSYHLTIPVREPRELNSEFAQNPVPGRRIVPSPDRDTEPSIIPPRGMDTRESL